MARRVVDLPAPLVPRMRDDLPGVSGQRDALHRRDGAVIDHLELVDARAAGSLIGARPRPADA